MGRIQIKGLDDRPIEINAGLFINNEFIDTTQTIDVTNPASQTKLATLSCAQETDIDAAVSAAKSAFATTWKATSPQKRGQLLNKLADLIERDGDDLAAIEALDAGVPFSDSKGLHVDQAVGNLRYFAGWADKISGKLLSIPNGIAYTVREPIGVCGAIVPWNAPLMITCWKIAPAIAAGNTLVIKTPEFAPLYGQKLADLILEAGFPPGVINVLCGEGKIAGKALAEHMEVRKIAFTGSTITGRSILKAAANSNLKKVTLELGGKSPTIVFEDADFDNAVSWATLGITANNGQICVAGSRIYVQSSIWDRFLTAFSKRSMEIVRGDPILSKTTKGPLINSGQHQKVMSYVEDTIDAGATVLHGGKSLEGNFIENTAFINVDEKAPILQEEIFGPVATISKFDTEAEVIAKANDTPYGLSSAIFTKDVDRAQRMASAIESGQVVVNAWGLLHANTPFGGVKQSGFGRDMGEDALDGWTSLKTVKYLRGPAPE